jgi:hypothetical protein
MQEGVEGYVDSVSASWTDVPAISLSARKRPGRLQVHQQCNAVNTGRPKNVSFRSALSFHLPLRIQLYTLLYSSLNKGRPPMLETLKGKKITGAPKKNREPIRSCER